MMKWMSTNCSNQEQTPSSNSGGNIQSPRKEQAEREGQTPSTPSPWTPEEMQEAEPYPMPDVSKKDAEEEEQDTSE